jgi:hypothetical protein
VEKIVENLTLNLPLLKKEKETFKPFSFFRRGVGMR